MSERRGEREKEKDVIKVIQYLLNWLQRARVSFEKNESLITINDYLILFVSEIVEWCVVMDPRAPHSI